MKKTLKIVPSEYLFYGLIILLLLFDISPLLGIIQYLRFRSNDAIALTVFFVVFVIFFNLLVFLSEMKQWFSRLYITSDGIIVKEIFMKKKHLDYSSHNKVFYGYMEVRGIPEWFIIISNRTFSRYELKNLNKIKQTDDYIKIKYSKKRREQLMEILPQNMAVQLKNPPQGKR